MLTPSAKQSILRMEARMQQAHLAQAHARQVRPPAAQNLVYMQQGGTPSF